MFTVPGGLRRQVLALLVSAVVPLAGLSVWLAIDEGRRDAAQAQAEARATVQLVKKDLDRVIQSTTDLIPGFGSNTAFRDAAQCNETLAALLPSFPQFANMTVTAYDGAIICAARNPTRLKMMPLTPAKVEVIRRLRETGKITIGSAEVSASTKLPQLPIVGPIQNAGGSGDPGLMFAASLDLRWLGAQVNRIPIPPQAILLVLDGRGNIAARNPPSTNFPAGSAAPPFERSLTAQDGFNGEVKGEDSIARLYSALRTGPKGDLAVILKVRASDIYKPSRERLILHLAGLGTVALLVFGLTWYGSDRYLTKPLSGLIGEANRLAGGDLSARSGLGYEGEIGVLASSFDAMASALQAESNHRVRTAEAFRVIVEGTSSATGDEFFRCLVRSLTTALQADFAMAGELTENRQSIRMLACCSADSLLPPKTYPLRGTPCEGVVSGGICYYPANVSLLFPEDELLREQGMESYLGTPLLSSGDPSSCLGLIAVLYKRETSREFLDAEPMLKIFAARAMAEMERLRVERALRGSMAQNEEMVRTLRDLMARLESVREEERAQISREIHDELGQQLTAMRFDLISLRKALTSPDPARIPVVERVNELTGMVDSTIRDVRRIATELRPGILDTFGLVAAIEWQLGEFGKHTGIHCHYEGPRNVSLSRDLATTVFRICQESLTNIGRHAKATEAWIRLEITEPDEASGGDWLLLTVHDNGIGMPPFRPERKSLGIIGMRERARIAGGALDIRSEADGGTTIVARLPRESGEKAFGEEQATV